MLKEAYTDEEDPPYPEAESTPPKIPVNVLYTFTDIRYRVVTEVTDEKDNS